ncbi:MAG: hypothetical protein ACI8RZ_000740 [Myxococcota bacterium]
MIPLHYPLSAAQLQRDALQNPQADLHPTDPLWISAHPYDSPALPILDARIEAARAVIEALSC